MYWTLPEKILIVITYCYYSHYTPCPSESVYAWLFEKYDSCKENLVFRKDEFRWKYIKKYGIIRFYNR